MTWIAVDVQARGLRGWAHESGGITPLVADLDGPIAARFESVLLDLLSPYLSDGDPLLVLCCGAGEPTVAVPATPPEASGAARVGEDPRIDLRLIAGMRQEQPSDLMRGAETAVAGFIAAYPKWDGVLCLTGDHSKWVHISAGEVVSFQTFMTGELFDLLSRKSSLRGDLAATGWDEAAFDQAVSDAMSRPEKVSGALFGLHASAQLGQGDPAAARARLFGMLLGMELAAARPYWLGQNVAVIGEGGDPAHYAAALKAQGVIAPCHDRGDMVLKGLQAAYASLQETTP